MRLLSLVCEPDHPGTRRVQFELLMHREGHVGIGMLLYSPFTYVLFEFDIQTGWGLGLVAMAVWSFAPDIDMQLPIRHRGPTHSLGAAVLAGLITATAAVYFLANGADGLVQTIPTYIAAIAFGFTIGFVGVIGHLVGDAMTPMGIRPWQPYSNRKYTWNLVYAKDKRANQGLSMIGAVALTGAIFLSTI